MRVILISSIIAEAIMSVHSFQPQRQSFRRPSPLAMNRRDWLVKSTASILTTQTILAIKPQYSNAAQQQDSSSSPVQLIQDGRDALTSLLDNWERATVDCTFADVPRELLEAKNKELLLEKASTFALFDKSTSVETCKTTNRIVRDYLGVTGKGPMVGMDKKLRKALDYVDPDRLDDYVAEIEEFSQSMSKAASLSYTAGVADVDSVNNFNKGEQNKDENSNLEQTRRAIMDAKKSMDRILDMFV